MSRNTVAKLAVLLVVLAVASLATGAPKNDKDKDQEYTQIYTYTYDEVFQATQEAIARNGWFVTGADKDKGTITGNGSLGSRKNTFAVHIETVSPKPETRLTVESHMRWGMDRRITANQLFVQLQKVLATYK